MAVIDIYYKPVKTMAEVTDYTKVSSYMNSDDQSGITAWTDYNLYNMRIVTEVMQFIDTLTTEQKNALRDVFLNDSTANQLLKELYRNEIAPIDYGEPDKYMFVVLGR